MSAQFNSSGLRILLLLSLLIGSAFSIVSKQKMWGYALQGGTTINSGAISITYAFKASLGCKVTVYLAGTTTAAVLYADNAGVIKANPFTSDFNTGYFEFYVASGCYDISFSEADISGPFNIREAPTQATTDRGNYRFDKEPAPSSGPTVRRSATAGVVDEGSHSYVVTFVTATGETQASSPAIIKLSDGGHRVELRNVPTGSNSVIARKIYRSKAVETGDHETDKYFLLATINDNTTTSYTDNTPDARLVSSARLIQNNTTGGYFFVNNTKAGFLGETNTYLGQLSMNGVKIGSYNTAMGVRSLGVSFSGDFNSAFGYEAMLRNTTGELNTAVGSQALFHNTTGRFNTAVGETSLGWNQTGSYNTAVGNQAGRCALGSNNAAFGVNALHGAESSTHECTGTVTGSENTVIGVGAHYNYTTGSRNTAAGFSALNRNTTGASNVAAGVQSLYYNQTGSNNVGVGENAGNTNTTGSGNTFIGYHSDVGASGLTNATAIGANAVVSQSNSLVLGNNVSVGVGTPSPKAKLDVTGGNLLIGTPGQGIILKSPDGATCKLLGIDNAGALAVSAIKCP
ncbi:MAG: hypothetical protein DMF68_10790 [Acidobacteria bacterium]|nr:MAG: hypothetical protein DMF68_10790 [Acidobacteriota bacterium]